jgi:hypothetical protein
VHGCLPPQFIILGFECANAIKSIIPTLLKGIANVQFSLELFPQSLNLLFIVPSLSIEILYLLLIVFNGGAVHSDALGPDPD